MTILQAVFLGALQGIAEFLPVSSSGHLALAAHFMNLSEVPLLFDVCLHLATLFAVLVVFRRRIAELLLTVWRYAVRKPLESDKAEGRLILALITATLVTAVIGFSIKDVVETLPPFWISCALVCTGLVLFFSGRYQSKKAPAEPGILQGLIIGAAQGIGVIPGISRSGSTISAALLCGIDRKKAGEFSFLLAIPAILAAFILEVKDADTLIGTVSAVSLAAGMLSSFVVGLASLKFLLALINRGRLGWFAFYLVPMGISLAVYFTLV